MRKQYPWFKVYSLDLLANGLSTYFTDAEVGVYYKLYAAAAISSTPGLIALDANDPRDLKALAQRLHTRKSFLTTTIAKLQRKGKLNQNEEGIHITAWRLDQEGVQPPLPGVGDHARVPKRGRQEKGEAPPDIWSGDQDPDKYAKQKHGHMVKGGRKQRGEAPPHLLKGLEK